MSRVTDKVEGDGSPFALLCRDPVIIALLNPDGGITPPDLAPPAGTNYHWANLTVMGTPDLEGMQKKLRDGWTFVPPSAHHGASAMPLDEAIECQAFCLMEKATILVQEQRARERAHHMDLDTRVLGIMKRYTGEAQRISIGGIDMIVDVTRRAERDGAEIVARPINTLDEVREELAKRGFPEADVRLFMKRRFGV